MSVTLSAQLQSALACTGVVQPVSVVDNCEDGYLEVLCRQVPGQEKIWLEAVDKLLLLEEQANPLLGNLHICRKYLRKNAQMVFGWHLAINCVDSSSLELAVAGIIERVLTDLKPSLVTVVQPVRLEPAVVPQTASRAPLAPGRHPPPRTMPPHPPNAPGTVVGVPPPAGSARLRVVQNFRDDNGKVTIIEEMALPHVYAEMNRPNAKGKGATLTAGS